MGDGKKGGGAHHRAELCQGGTTRVDVVGVLGVLGGSRGADDMQMDTVRSRVVCLSAIASCNIGEMQPELVLAARYRERMNTA
jgi:hypothetical protein